MAGVDRFRRRRSLHGRLGIKGIICCGSTWGIGSSTMSIHGGEASDDGDDLLEIPDILPPQPEVSDPDCVFPSPRMNLAAALAAERDSRSTAAAVDGGELLNVNVNDNRSTMTAAAAAARESPARMSLMRLLEETDDQDEKEGVGMDLVCCVCMGRKKSAAFIPCGHTFCRVCSRELWLNRGACPLCNRSIVEVLDIY